MIPVVNFNYLKLRHIIEYMHWRIGIPEKFLRTTIIISTKLNIIRTDLAEFRKTCVQSRSKDAHVSHFYQFTTVFMFWTPSVHILLLNYQIHEPLF